MGYSIDTILNYLGKVVSSDASDELDYISSSKKPSWVYSYISGYKEILERRYEQTKSTTAHATKPAAGK